jgi:peptide/nickel transport system permease protein
MKVLRVISLVILASVALLAIVPELVVSDAPDEQFREHVDEAPGARFPLGTDSLGRNRLSRLLHGTRTSLLLAPAAALSGVALAVAAGVLAAAGGRLANRAFEFTVDLMGSLPWLFVLIAVRATLPLDASPLVVNASTFIVLATLGWAGPARVIRNVAASARSENWFLQGDAAGLHPWRIWSRYLTPVVLPVAAAQVWINIPVFILSEANLGLLGLGVAEPAPSLGNLMRELENVHSIPYRPWILAPVVVLALTVWSLHVLVRRREVRC